MNKQAKRLRRLHRNPMATAKATVRTARKIEILQAGIAAMLPDETLAEARQRLKRTST